ncbi:glycosyltransferase family 2 protein, partial [Candidatus Parcubacteria bacterium]|nr:glycosyltransferase family 2 protein [Candidatus Parcubacteria bacterium]
MPTIFTLPKPFTDAHIKIIQTNAIKSWTKLGQDYEVFIIGDEPGITEAAKELNVKQIKDVKKNEFGTPLLSSAFALARESSRSKILIYVNSDIIFPPNFNDIFKFLPKGDFLAAGKRWDLDINNLIDF